MNFEDTITFPKIPVYPVLEDDFDLCEWGDKGIHLDRRQIQMDPSRRAMLVRHTTELHWCGYVPVIRSQWNAVAERVIAATSVRITWEGFSTQQICWMSRNQQGKLKIPTPLLPGLNFEEQYWIGFDTRRHAIFPLMSDEDATAMLYGFENLVWSAISGRLTLGG